MHWQFMEAAGERTGLTPGDRGFAYADGLFETIAIRAGKPRFLDAHLDRLILGGSRLGLELPARERLGEFLLERVSTSPFDVERAVVKLIATRGEGRRGYRYDASAARILAGIGPAQAANADPYRRGVLLRWCRTRCGRNPALAGLKHLARLEQVLARAEWRDDAVAEGLMLDSEGRVVCGTMSNVFLVRRKRIVTPALTHAGVAGIMRATVLRVASDLDLAVEVREVMPADIGEADEIFLTNSQIGVWPVRGIGRQSVGGRDVTHTVMEALEQIGVAEWDG